MILAAFRLGAALCLLSYVGGALAQPEAAGGVQAAPSTKEEKYCANVAASAEALRLERKRKEVADLEAAMATRLQALEAKQTELRALLDRLEAFERKTSAALIGLYSKMKPEQAAAQLAQLDDEVAAAVILELKTKTSSAILGEMDASRGAALAKKISDLKNTSSGKAKP